MHEIDEVYLGESEKQKIASISFLMSIFVVLIHSYNIDLFQNVGWISTLFEQLFSISIFGYGCVNVFFFISGLLLSNNCADIKSVIKKFPKRLYTLGVPYLFWSLLGYVFYLVINYIPFISSYINTQVANLSFNNLFNAVVFSKYTSQLWYIRTLLLYIILSPVMLLLSKKKIVRYILITIMIVIILLGYRNDIFKFERMIFFYTGLLSGKYKYRLPIMKPNKLTCIMAIIAICALAAADIIFNAVIIDSLLYIMIPCLLWIALDPVTRKYSFKLSQYSFLLYCSHRLVLDPVKKLLILIFKKSGKYSIPIYCLTALITIFVVLFMIKLFDKIAPKFINFISGGRNNRSDRKTKQNLSI